MRNRDSVTVALPRARHMRLRRVRRETEIAIRRIMEAADLVQRASGVSGGSAPGGAAVNWTALLLTFLPLEVLRRIGPEGLSRIRKSLAVREARKAGASLRFGLRGGDSRRNSGTPH